MVFGEVDAPLAEDLRDSPLAALDAIRDAYAPVATAGEGKAGNLGAAILDQYRHGQGARVCTGAYRGAIGRHSRRAALQKG